MENSESPAAEPQGLDIWLSEGVVLVDPTSGDLMIFERWGSKGAQLRNQRTGAQHIVGQSDVTTWKYIPREVEASQVWRSKETGDLVLTVETRGDGVQMCGMDKDDRLFWLARAQLVEFFDRAPDLPA